MASMSYVGRDAALKRAHRPNAQRFVSSYVIVVTCVVSGLLLFVDCLLFCCFVVLRKCSEIGRAACSFSELHK